MAAMAHDDNIRTGYSRKKYFDFLMERQKLLDNFEQLRKTSKEMSILSYELRTLQEEIQSNKADVQILRAALNAAAANLGIQPIPEI